MEELSTAGPIEEVSIQPTEEEESESPRPPTGMVIGESESAFDDAPSLEDAPPPLEEAPPPLEDAPPSETASLDGPIPPRNLSLRAMTPSPRSQFMRIMFPPVEHSHRPPTRVRSGPSESATPQLIQSTCDTLMRGKPLRIDDPYIVAEVIDELNARRIEALQSSDYKEGKKIQDAIFSARLQFRQHDRDILHQEILSRLDERYKDAVAAAATAKENWKQKRRELLENHRNDLLDLEAKQEDEHKQLETEWAEPEMVRKFDKRSPTLLQNRQVEHYLVLCGDLMGADQMKRINAQTEKVELKQREREMEVHFAIARGNLLKKQDREIEKVRMEQQSELEIQAEEEHKDMTAKTRRVEATQRTLTEEKELQRFIRKKFHRTAEIVVPTTVMTCKEASQDLPPLSYGKIVPPGTASMLEFRKKVIVTKLPLRALAIRHYKPQPLVKVVKPKKPDV